VAFVGVIATVPLVFGGIAFPECDALAPTVGIAVFSLSTPFSGLNGDVWCFSVTFAIANDILVSLYFSF
jgi:hypothetical protein